MQSALMSTPAHTWRVLEGLLTLPGHIEDVARKMIWLARNRGDQGTTECEYCGVTIHAHAASTVAEVAAAYECVCRDRPPHAVRVGRAIAVMAA